MPSSWHVRGAGIWLTSCQVQTVSSCSVAVAYHRKAILKLEQQAYAVQLHSLAWQAFGNPFTICMTLLRLQDCTGKHTVILAVLPWHHQLTALCAYCFCRGHDVFNALDIFENKAILEKLKFGIGDGSLRYYLYNWRCSAKLGPADVGLILL